MTDGRKVEGKREGSNGGHARSNSDEFGRAVSKIAVAQICKTVGFDGCTESGLEALADITVRYLCDLGKTANFYANLAGRTECNVFDVIQGLEEMGSSTTGFLGASDVNHSLTTSGVVKEIVEYVGSAEEVQFAQPLANFPVVRNRLMTPSFLQMGEAPKSKHIPPWLPAFPDPHTYIHTPTWNERSTDPREDKIELARQRRKAERSLLSLQQRLVSVGSSAASTSADAGNERESLQVTQFKTPYLDSPMIVGSEKEITPVSLPSKLSDGASVGNHVSVLETFAPALEAMEGGLSNNGDTERRIHPEKRSAIQFTFKTGKKILGKSLDLTLLEKFSGRKAQWIGRDDEKDDKKRRAELILRQTTENPLELTQL